MKMKRIGEKTAAEWKRSVKLYLEGGTWLQRVNWAEQREVEILILGKRGQEEVPSKTQERLRVLQDVEDLVLNTY